MRYASGRITLRDPLGTSRATITNVGEKLFTKMEARLLWIWSDPQLETAQGLVSLCSSIARETDANEVVARLRGAATRAGLTIRKGRVRLCGNRYSITIEGNNALSRLNSAL